MERYTRCGSESAFYHEHEMASESEASFVSPLMAILSASIPGNLDERKDPEFDGAITIRTTYVDWPAILKKLEDAGEPVPEGEDWLDRVVGLVSEYGVDPVVITSEFERSVPEDAKDDVLEQIGFMLSMALFSKGGAKGFESKGLSAVKGERIIFVTEGSAAHHTYMAAKELIEREGFERVEHKWSEIVAREASRPLALKVFSPEELQLRNALRAYSSLGDIKIVPNARQSAEEYLTKMGAFECARIIP